jgi:hypothetical protein
LALPQRPEDSAKIRGPRAKKFGTLFSLFLVRQLGEKDNSSQKLAPQNSSAESGNFS